MPEQGGISPGAAGSGSDDPQAKRKAAGYGSGFTRRLANPSSGCTQENLKNFVAKSCGLAATCWALLFLPLPHLIHTFLCGERGQLNGMPVLPTFIPQAFIGHPDWGYVLLYEMSAWNPLQLGKYSGRTL